MSTRILANDDDEKGETGAVLFDGTTGRAYGHRFDDYEQADAFVRWVIEETGADPAKLTQVEYDLKRTKFLNEWAFCGLSDEEIGLFKDLERKRTAVGGVTWKMQEGDEKGYRRLSGMIEEARIEKFGIE